MKTMTQVFATLTFDSPAAAFHPDAIAQLLGAQRKKSFMLHYEFPRFAVNEIGLDFSFIINNYPKFFTLMMVKSVENFSDAGGQNRRELGHGLLAERALKNVLPEKFPYTIRLACQVLSSLIRIELVTVTSHEPIVVLYESKSRSNIFKNFT